MLLDTPVCEFGWKSPDWTLPDLGGKLVSMAESGGDHGLVIAFICNHCPYVKAIISRMVEDANVLADEGIATLAIMPNDFQTYPDDSPREMKKFAVNHHFTFPYLLDADQSVARVYGAVCTPDFFGFNGNGELQYRGRLDDAKMADATDRVPELLTAMRQIAKSGKGPTQQVPSMGCSIKWKS